jgi:hypothetical protein
MCIYIYVFVYIHVGGVHIYIILYIYMYVCIHSHTHSRTQVVQAYAVFTNLREKVEHFYNRLEARVRAPAASLKSPLHDIIISMGNIIYTTTDWMLESLRQRPLFSKVRYMKLLFPWEHVIYRKILFTQELHVSASILKNPQPSEFYTVI